MMEGALLVVMILFMVFMCGGMIFGGMWALTRRRGRSNADGDQKPSRRMGR